MTSFLAGKATTDEIIKHNEICENLDFIPAGPIAPNPSELLLSEQLEVMIAELRNRYDYIFVDNVPVGVVADAAITNRIADHLRGTGWQARPPHVAGVGKNIP